MIQDKERTQSTPDSTSLDEQRELGVDTQILLIETRLKKANLKGRDNKNQSWLDIACID